MTGVTYGEAAKQAVAEAMRADPRVWALGEDLGRGGVFGQYRGLAAEFGDDRVVDTPISEATIMGAAVGAALVGTRSIVEMRFSDFALCAIDELINQAAKNRYMFGGQGRVPIVVRQPMGLWRSSAAQHSQSLESWYTHIPGLVVVAPSTPADNYALMTAAIAADDPVVYLEHKDLWAMEGPIAPPSEALGIGKARLLRTGGDITLISWSKMAHVTASAAAALADQGISCEVIDLCSLWPWDTERVLESVGKTGRLMVVHEAVQVSGFGAEIAATVAEELGVPVRRLAGPRIPVAYSPPLEDVFRVDETEVVAAVSEFVGA